MKASGFFGIKATRTGIIIFILVIALCVMGTTYASWSEYLGISPTLLSGSFSVVFGQDNSYSVAVVDKTGAIVGSQIGSNNITCTLDKQNKVARLYLDTPLLLDELTQPNRLLMLRYPLLLDESSTVQSVTPYKDDLNQPAGEHLQFTAESVQLTINGYKCPLPQNWQYFEQPLYWDVYRAIEVENDNIIGIILLQLRAESLGNAQNPAQLMLDVAELPAEMAEQLTPEEGGEDGSFPAEIEATYEFSVPLYIEQGH